jgi:hypothetical protein
VFRLQIGAINYTGQRAYAGTASDTDLWSRIKEKVQYFFSGKMCARRLYFWLVASLYSRGYFSVP